MNFCTMWCSGRTETESGTGRYLLLSQKQAASSLLFTVRHLIRLKIPSPTPYEILSFPFFYAAFEAGSSCLIPFLNPIILVTYFTSATCLPKGIDFIPFLPTLLPEEDTTATHTPAHIAYQSNIFNIAHLLANYRIRIAITQRVREQEVILKKTVFAEARSHPTNRII